MQLMLQFQLQLHTLHKLILMNITIKRHILKTVSYRILGTLTTVATAYAVGVPIELSSVIGIVELVIKPVIYFLHERLWYRFIRLK
jgi:uncharacterized membrane protein